MNKRVISFVIAGLVLFGLALGTTYLCARHFAAGQGGSGNIYASHNWAHEIGLSKEQEKQLEPLEKTLQKDLSSIQLKLAQDRMALCSLMRQEPADTKELDTYITRVAQLEAEQQRRVVQHLLAMRDILTPAQKDKFFSAIMQGICQGCRMSTHSGKDMCGMCNLKRG